MYIKLFEKFKNNINFKINQDEDNTEIKAFYGNKEVGILHADLIFDIFSEVSDGDTDTNMLQEDDIYNIFTDDIIVKISYMSVDENYMSKSIGTSLFKKALEYFYDNGFTQFYLNASPMGFKGLNLDNLIKFYEKFGFKVFKKYDGDALMYLTSKSTTNVT